MRRPLTATAVLAFCSVGLVATAAQGQWERARINRPSEWAPSTRVGQTGGIYTRYEDVAKVPGGTGPRVGGLGLQRPTYFGAVGRIGGLAPAPMPAAFAFAQVGYNARPARLPSLAGMRGATPAELARVSGLWASQRPSVPLTGLGPYQIKLPDRPYYVPEPEGTALHEFFGLKPMAVESRSETPVPVDGLVGLLEQENEQFLREYSSWALSAFKHAMRDRAQDGGDALWEAQQALTAVRDLDLEAYIPCLLLVHTALERDQIRVGVRRLADTVRRHPSIFIERPDVASYYGDAEWLEEKQAWRSELLEQQMRKHLRIGDENPGHPGAYVLQAYCAWVLNDPTRVRYALDRLMAADQRAQVGAEAIAVRHALAAAMK
ncbi:MAG: hypothetical protein ACE5I3_05035 [Phycisphaerae bacterium]